MPSQYPESIDLYREKADGVDVVTAVDFNNLQDAITAIETELGTEPRGTYTSVASALTEKVSKSGDVMRGYLDMGFFRITHVGAPTAGDDAATRTYVDGVVSINNQVVCPWIVDVNPLTTLHNSGWSYVTWNTAATSPIGFVGYTRNSSGTQGDWLEVPVVIGAGSWAVELVHATSADAGIVHLFLDDTAIGTIDTYSNDSPPVFGASGVVTGIVVARDGKHVLRLAVDSKSSSSSGYAVRLQCLQMRRIS